MDNTPQNNIAPFQSTPHIPHTVHPPTNLLKILTITVLGLFIAGGLVFVGIQFGKRYPSDNIKTAVQPSVALHTQIVNPTTSPKLDSELLTYTDENFKYSFKYSPKGVVKKLEKRDSLLLGGASFSLKYSDVFRPQASETYISVYNNNGLKLNEWIELNSSPKPYGSEAKEFMDYATLGNEYVNGLEGVSFKCKIMGFVCQNIALEKNNYIYVLGYVKVADDLSNEYSQLLSTFKFTDQLSTIRNWETYTNSSASFSIRYPSGWRKVESTNQTGFGPQEIGEDVVWGISFYNKSDKTITQIKDELGKKFPDRTQTEEIISINGLPATKVITTTKQSENWYSVLIIIDSGNMLYAISNGSQNDKALNEMITKRTGKSSNSSFEDLYMSFRILK